MFSREIFASRLTNLCKEAGITNAAFADSCGITPGALSMLQKANRSPSVELLCKMADLLGVTVDYLSGSDGAPSPKETDTLYLEISALAPFDREEVMRYARYVRANPRK